MVGLYFDLNQIKIILGPVLRMILGQRDEGFDQLKSFRCTQVTIKGEGGVKEHALQKKTNYSNFLLLYFSW